MKRRLWWSLPTALCSLWPWTLQLSGHPCKSPFLCIQFLNCKILNDLRCCQRCSCWTEVQNRAVVWWPRNRMSPSTSKGICVCVLSASNVSWVLWPNFAWNSVLGALELACPREMTSTVPGPTGGNKMSQRPLSAHLCHLLRERQGWSLLAGHPTAWLPKTSPGLVRRGNPIGLVYWCFSLGSRESLIPCSFSQRGTPPAFWPGPCSTTGDCPILQGVNNFSHIPPNASCSYYEKQNHPKHFQMPLGLWQASWLRTTAVFTDEVHLYKYSVFLPDKNNDCPYWSIWHSTQKPSLK